MDRDEPFASGDAPMAPSAPLPLPPPVPLNAFLGADETVQPSNGHSTGALPVPPQLKLPGKSNLRRHSMFAIGSPHQPTMRHSQSCHSTSDPSIALESDGANGGPNSSGHGHGPGVGRSPQRQQSKVRWTDSHGKDLTEVWEFEPRYPTLIQDHIMNLFA